MEFKLGTELLEYNEKRKRIKIPEGIAFISSYAFAYNEEIQEVIFPKTLKGIGDYAFSNCSNLKEIVFPSNIEEIGRKCFSGCTNLERVIIKADDIGKGNDKGFETTIKAEAFSDCKSLYSFEIHKNIDYMEEGVFKNCVLLRNFNFPKGVSYVPQETFYGCENLANVNLPDGVNYIGSKAFYKCKALRRMNFPLGNHHQYHLSSECINFPSCLKYIDHMAFAESGVEVIVIPGNAPFISSDAFKICDNISKVYKVIDDELQEATVSSLSNKEKVTEENPAQRNILIECTEITNKNLHVLNILKEFEFTEECINKIRKILCEYKEKYMDELFVGGHIFNTIMEEFYNDKTSVIDRFYVMSILVQSVGMSDEDEEAFKNELNTLKMVLREEERIRETDQFVTEDGKRFERMKDALEYIKTTIYDECYIVDKENCYTGEIICRYWYDEELVMRGYA